MRAPEIYIPDGLPPETGLSRTTHLGIGAHQDDLEFMAFHGIAECFYSADRWFGGVICTDGKGSSRKGPYANTSDDELCEIRMREQRQAADIGRYSFVAQLMYPSGSIVRPQGTALVEELRELLAKTCPEVVYTHNPADKHVTHIRVLVAVMEAIKQLPASGRPQRLYGCEGWRGLDWLDDAEKIVMDVSGSAHLASALNGVFDSQIAGGKRYDLAVAGRRKANATFLNAKQGDAISDAALAIDLTPLIGADPSELLPFTLKYVDRLRQNIQDHLENSLSQ